MQELLKQNGPDKIPPDRKWRMKNLLQLFKSTNIQILSEKQHKKAQSFFSNSVLYQTENEFDVL